MSELWDLLTSMVPEPRVEPQVKFGYALTDGPSNSSDLERIVALPRRPAFKGDELNLAAEYTLKYRREGGTWNLWPIQAFALRDLEQSKGLVAHIKVGGGKTALGALAGTAVGAKRVLYLCPHSVEEQVRTRAVPELARQFRIPNLANAIYCSDTDAILHVASYETVSRRPEFLVRLAPDLIILDEAHAVSNTTAARTKRFRDYVRTARPRLVVMSGTLLAKSIEDLIFFCTHTLGLGSPVPISYQEGQLWSSALDPVGDPSVVAPPGELVRLCNFGETLREGFRRRFTETLGCVATSEEDLGTSLVIQERKVKVPKEIREALEKLKETWTTPGGERLQYELDYYRVVSQVCTGFFYRWVWPEGTDLALKREWLDSRREYHQEVRAFLEHGSKPGLDSPGLLALAADRFTALYGKYQKKYPNGTKARWARIASWLSRRGKLLWRSETRARWLAVKDSLNPPTEAVWLNDFLIEDVAKWGDAHVGVVWYRNRALGERLASKTGWPLAKDGHDLERLIKEAYNKTPIIVSLRIGATGIDGLQRLFSEQLVVSPPASNKGWEQMLGRLHRMHQKADEVTTWAYMHVPEYGKALKKAVAEAEFVQQSVGSSQKLLTSTLTFPL